MGGTLEAEKEYPMGTTIVIPSVLKLPINKDNEVSTSIDVAAKKKPTKKKPQHVKRKHKSPDPQKS